MLHDIMKSWLHRKKTPRHMHTVSCILFKKQTSDNDLMAQYLPSKVHRTLD